MTRQVERSVVITVTKRAHQPRARRADTLSNLQRDEDEVSRLENSWWWTHIMEWIGNEPGLVNPQHDADNILYMRRLHGV
jgi:hypothetical protein